MHGVSTSSPSAALSQAVAGRKTVCVAMGVVLLYVSLQAFSNILTYMRNQEYYGSDYNLAEYVAEQASDVDADQIAG